MRHLQAKLFKAGAERIFSARHRRQGYTTLSLGAVFCCLQFLGALRLSFADTSEPTAQAPAAPGAPAGNLAPIEARETAAPELARRHMEEGLKLYKQGYFARALDSLNHAITQDSSFLPAYAARAIVHNALTHTQDARQDMEKCQSMGAEDVLNLTLRGNVRLLSGDISSALEDFNQTILNNSYYADAYLGRGRAYRATGNWKEAMEDWNKAISLDPKLLIARFDHAQALNAQGDPSKALNELKEVLHINSQFPLAYALAGAITAGNQEYERAISNYSQAIRLNPDYAYAFLGRAAAYLQIGDKESAFKDYAEAVRKAPEDYAPFFERGEIYWRLGDTGAALTDFKSALELRLDYPPAAMFMGERLEEGGLKEEALKMVSKAIDSANTAAPNMRMAWTEKALLQRAQLHVKLDEKAEALKDIDEAIDISSNSAQSLMARADFYFQTSQTPRAREELDQILGEYPQYPPALLVRGKLYANEGRWKEALADLDAAIQAASDTAKAYSARGLIYARSSNDYDKAVADISKAISLSPGDAESHLNLAMVETKRRNYRKAEEALNTASGLHAEPAVSIRILQSKAQTHSSLGNLKAAIDEIHSALELDPRFPALYTSLGSFDLQTLDPDQALQDLGEGLNLGPNSIQVRLYSGLAYAMQGKYAEAAKEFQTATTLDRQSAEAHDLLCRTLRLEKDFRRALRSCDRAIELDSELPTAYIDRGLTRFWLRDYESAVADLQAGFSKGVRYASVELARSAALAMLGRSRESDQAYRSAADIDPTAHDLEVDFVGGQAPKGPDYGAFLSAQDARLDVKEDPFSLLVRGNALNNAGHFEAAADRYTQALAMDANSVGAYLDRCDALSAQQSMDAAEQDCRHAVELDPKNLQAQLRLIQLLTLRQRMDAALQATVAAIRIIPNAAALFEQGGNVRYFMKDVRRAQDNYNLALSADPTFADAYNGLGLCQYAQKQYLESIESFSRAIALNTRKDSYYRNRAAAYVGLKDFRNAIFDFKNALAVNTDSGMTEEYQKRIQQALSQMQPIDSKPPTVPASAAVTNAQGGAQ